MSMAAWEMLPLAMVVADVRLRVRVVERQYHRTTVQCGTQMLRARANPIVQTCNCKQMEKRKLKSR